MMSKVMTASLVLAIVMLAAPVAFPPDGPPNPGFARMVAGTYVDNGVIGIGAFTGLQTIHADGTHTSTNTNCCGAANGAPQSHGQGVWKQTGQRQVTLTAVILLFQEDGTPLFTARVTLVMDFDPDFKTATGPITTELFAFGADVTDPDELPFLTVGGEDTWSRLEVVDLAPPIAW